MKAAWTLLISGVMPLSAAQPPCPSAALHMQLVQLQSVVARCAESKTKQACDPAGAADDSVVLLASGPRPVDLGWLRAVLAAAPKSKTAAAQLQAAGKRLDRELVYLSSQSSVPSATLRQENTKLRDILADGDFPKPQPPSLLQRWWRDFTRWLGSKLQVLAGSGSGQRWVAPILLLCLLAAACGGLLWWFSRVTRSHRLRVGVEARPANPEVGTEQDWQVWLEQSRQLAGRQQWRESIHRVYWSAIAQLESRGVWRPDKARTPREYLALVDPASDRENTRQSARRDALMELTRCFERFWYGGRVAVEQDYLRACALFEKVTSG